MLNKAIMAVKFLTEDKEVRLVVPPPPRGTREGKKLWETMRLYCSYEGSLEPECIDTWYASLDDNHLVEFGKMVEQFIDNQLIIALFGWELGLWSMMCSAYFFVFPHIAPSIDDAPWEEVSYFFRGMMILMVTWTANLTKPNFFFIQ